MRKINLLLFVCFSITLSAFFISTNSESLKNIDTTSVSKLIRKGVEKIMGEEPHKNASKKINTTLLAADSDGDGVDDNIDLDDDNDGILDSNEFASCSTGVSVVWASTTTGLLSNTFTAGSGGTAITGTAVTAATSNATSGPKYVNGTNSIDVIARGGTAALTGNSTTVTFPIPVTMSEFNVRSISCANGSASVAPNYDEIQIVEFYLGADRVYFDGTPFTSTAGTIYKHPYYSGIDATYNTIGPYYNKITGVAYPSNVTINPASPAYPGTGAVEVNYRFVINQAIDRIVVKQAPAGKNDNVGFTFYGICSGLQDTDNDTIPDHLDLDSDNDGCPDAIEGGANITASQLVTAGGTVTVGTGSTSSNVNLANSSAGVDANGVPLTTGASGQSVGNSTNATANDCSITAVDDPVNVSPGVATPGNVLTNDTAGASLSVSAAQYYNSSGTLVALPLGTATQIYTSTGTLAGTLTLNSNGAYTFTSASGFSGSVPVNYTALSTAGSTDNAVLTLNVFPDSDGDGFPDNIDLDDDNDGILDTVENSCDNPLISWEIGTTNGQSVANFFTGSGATAVVTTTITSGGMLGTYPTYITSTSTNTIKALSFGGTTTVPNTLGAKTVIQFDEKVTIGNFEVASLGCANASLSYNEISTVKFYSGTTQVIFNGTLFADPGKTVYAHSSYPTVYYDSSTGIAYPADMTATRPADKGEANYRFNLNTPIDRIEIQQYTGAKQFNVGFLMAGVCSVTKDNDGDGIADYLDLDSDNDGCQDAIEGGGGFTNANLVSSGGTVTVGTGSTATNMNLCGGTTCVDSNGVPTIAGSGGQTIGNSQNAALSNCFIDAIKDINQTPAGVSVSGNVTTNDESGSAITVQSAQFYNSAGALTNLPLGTSTQIYTPTGTLAGSITLNADGTYTFVPATGFTGNVPVNYTAVNTVGNTDTTTLEITVIPDISFAANDSPIAENDNAATELNTPVSSNALSNDSDPEGNTLTITGATQGATTLTLGSGTTVSGIDANGNAVANAGSIVLNADGTYTFTPNTGFTGTVNPITYTISDGNGGTDTATINIAVYPNSGNSTYANDDANSAPKGTTMTGNVLTNDTDPEGNTQTVTAATTLGGTSITIGTATSLTGVGTLTLNSNGTYTFVPDANYVGTTAVVYTICDDGIPSVCDQATLYLTELALGVCYNNANTGTTGIDSKHGITLLQRAAADNGNWPMIRKSAHTVLESNTKGFVVTRVAKANLGNITNPQEGMMVYDTTDKCLKIYTDSAWKCFSTPSCP